MNVPGGEKEGVVVAFKWLQEKWLREYSRRTKFWRRAEKKKWTMVEEGQVNGGRKTRPPGTFVRHLSFLILMARVGASDEHFTAGTAETAEGFLLEPGGLGRGPSEETRPARASRKRGRRPVASPLR